MSITYETTTVRPKIDSYSNDVHSWVFGVTGIESGTGTSAYYDAVWDVSDDDLIEYTLWTKSNIDAEIAKCVAENDMHTIIDKKIMAKNAKKVAVRDFDYNAVS